VTTSPATARRVRRHAAVAASVVGAVLAVGVPGVADAAPAASTPPHGMGAVFPAGHVSAAEGLADLAQAQGGVRAAETLPASVDLTEYAVPPSDQGQTGACASFTSGYTLAGWLSNYTHHTGAPFAPQYLYNQLNGGSASRGTTFAANFGILSNQGVAEAAYWSHPATDYRSQPTAAEKTDAALHKMTSYTQLFLGDGQGSAAQTAIETALASNKPVALGIPVYNAFNYLTPSDSTFTLADATGSVLGGHAVAVLGYDSTGVIIENSWGAGWGDGGFATLGWDFVNAKAQEADVPGTFVTGAATLAPAVTALSSSTVTTGGGATLTVTAARASTVDTTNAAAVRFVSTTDSTVSVNAAVTASTATSLTVTVPQLPADGSYRVVVTGSGGTSAPNGTADVVTALSPYSVVLADGAAGRTDVATQVVLVGSGFGATSAQFTANKVTATLGGKVAKLTWVDDSHLKVAVPTGPAGSLSLVVSRNGLAGAPVTVPVLPPLPVVTALNPAKVAVGGGTSVVATVRNAATVSGATTVTLVSTADRSVTLTAPITATSATSVTFTVPEAPNGTPADFDVVVTGTGGKSAVVKADLLSYRSAFSGTTTATALSAAGGTKVTVTGSGYGTTAAAFAANKVTATVAGKTAPVKWVNDTTLVVTAPAGTPGTAAPIVLAHDKVAGSPITGVTYAAVISGNSTPAGPTTGWTTTVTGAGLAKSTGWALVDGTGAEVATLPLVTSKAALTSASSGVYLASPTSAVVKLPSEAAGMYRLAFTPTAGSQAFTSKAVVSYSDLG
jgi:Papain family cysteine protease/IPT/TIG domain